MKVKFLNRMNVLLASLMALLGFSCGESGGMYGPELKYGIPYTVNINGGVTDDADTPLKGIRMEVKDAVSHYAFYDILSEDEHFFTDEDGKWSFQTRITDWELRSMQDSVLLVAHDDTDVYAADSVKTALTYEDSDVATAVVNLILKKNQ